MRCDWNGRRKKFESANRLVWSFCLSLQAQNRFVTDFSSIQCDFPSSQRQLKCRKLAEFSHFPETFREREREYNNSSLCFDQGSTKLYSKRQPQLPINSCSKHALTTVFHHRAQMNRTSRTRSLLLVQQALASNRVSFSTLEKSSYQWILGRNH